jgi:hypothetical protein
MKSDILAPFRSGGGPDDLADFRTRIKEDPEALATAGNLWIDATYDALAPVADCIAYADDFDEGVPAIAEPDGYTELVFLLMWWCDQSPFNIDATPLVDFMVALDDLRQWDWHKATPDAFYIARQAEKRARYVVQRMMFARFIEAGKAPPKLKDKSRNPDRDNWIVEQREAGVMTLEEIAKGTQGNPQWEAIYTPQGIEKVLKRRGFK